MGKLILGYKPTVEQMKLLKHTLGLDNEKSDYRNHFVAGPGHTDMPDLLILEEEGMMYRAKTPAWIHEKDILFMASNEGKAMCKGIRRK